MAWLGDWACLPSVALTEIYHYLGDADRAHMALACEHWSQVFNDPCLWTERHFRFGGYRTNRAEVVRAVGFARAQGAALKVLHIRSDHPGFSACKRFQRALASLVNCLLWRKTQLRELNISQLSTERYWRLGDVRQRLVTCLCRFLRRQATLQVMDVSDAGLAAESGLCLFEAMTILSGPSLKNLDIQDLFQIRVSAYLLPRYVQVMTRFRQLHTLHLNYAYISDDIVKILTSRSKASLRVINIKVSRNDPHGHVIENATWWTVQRTCPLLRVVLSLEGVVAYNDVMRILQRSLPLYSLNLWTGVSREGEPPRRLADMILYLGERFGNVLEELSMCLENRWEPVDSALLTMLPRCRQLTVLEIQGVVEVNTLDAICDLQDTYKIGLTRCHVTLENATFNEIEELNDVLLQHDDMIEERDLDFIFMTSQHPFI